MPLRMKHIISSTKDLMIACYLNDFPLCCNIGSKSDGNSRLNHSLIFIWFRYSLFGISKVSLTKRILIFFLFPFSFVLPRTNFTGLSFGPLINSIASSIPTPLVDFPSTSRITSPDSISALDAGVPLIIDCIVISEVSVFRKRFTPIPVISFLSLRLELWFVLTQPE